MHPLARELTKPEINVTLPTRSQFLATSQKQGFSLPETIILYISKYPPSLKIYRKLIKCCKYFFIKNSIILSEAPWSFQNYPGIIFSNFSTKLWNSVTDSSIFSSFPPEFHEYNVAELTLYNACITFDYFLFLSAAAKCVTLSHVSIKYSNGNEVEFEKLVAVCRKAEVFNYAFPLNPTNISPQTIQELIKIPHLLWKQIHLRGIPDTFDIKTFMEFLKKTHLYVTFEFSQYLSNQYRMLLSEIVYEILQTNNFIYGPPLCIIPGVKYEVQTALYQVAKK